MFSIPQFNSPRRLLVLEVGIAASWGDDPAIWLLDALSPWPCSVSTLGVLAVGVKAWCSFKAVSGGSGNLVTLTAQKFLDLPFSKEASQETVEGSLAGNGGWETSLRKVSFYQRTMLLF